ncbi:MAG: DegV family protein [Neisseria sp.]|nr:DegV family protein [Neisseria sp.]
MEEDLIEPEIQCAVVAASSGSLDEVDNHDDLLHILRMNIHMGGLNHLDGIDMRPEAFYLWQQEFPRETVSTSPPSEKAVRTLFRELAEFGYREVIVTLPSAYLDDTLKQVVQVAEEMADSLTVYAVDTGTVCMPEGHFALEAVRLLRQGMAAGEVVDYLNRMKEKTEIVFSLHSLHHLRKSRFVSSGIHLSDLLNLKPVFCLHNGRLSQLDSGRKSESILDSLVETVSGKTRGLNIRAYGLYAGNRQLYDRFAEKIYSKTNMRLEAFPISPVVGAFIGPDAVGIGWVEDIAD